MIDENRSRDELLALGFEDEFIEDIKKRVKINEFKRKLPIIAKI
jgi:NAD+ synthase